MKIRIKRYRIVKDSFAGYEVQIWRIWFPFWVQMRFVNTHSSIEDAEEFIKRGKIVKYID